LDTMDTLLKQSKGNIAALENTKFFDSECTGHENCSLVKTAGACDCSKKVIPGTEINKSVNLIPVKAKYNCKKAISNTVRFFILFFLLGGILCSSYSQKMFDELLKKEMVIREGTYAYSAWKESNIPFYTKMYLFHIRNPAQFLDLGAKPIMEERGPYTFRTEEKKNNIVSNLDGTVSYRRAKFWYFEPGMSNGSLSDIVTTINMPAVGAAEFARGDFLMEYGVSDLLSSVQAKLFVNKTVGQLLFDGYEDEIVMLKAAMETQDKGEVDVDSDDWSMEDWSRKRKKRSYMPDDEKFGWFYKRNGTDWADGALKMYTGKGDMSSLGQLKAWNERDTTDVFSGHCAKVRGSSDGLWPPGLATQANYLEYFSTDLCRSLKFEREESVSHFGLKGQRFVLSPTAFANSSVCPDNSCYGNNLPSGVQNNTRCKVESPAFVSRPHFMLADPFYLEQFQSGISPDVSRHESEIVLEPTSSIPLKVSIRLQINILVDRVPGIQYLFQDVPRLMFPVLWFDTQFIIPEDIAPSIKVLLALPLIFKVTGAASAIFGSLYFFCLFICWTRRRALANSYHNQSPERGTRPH